MMVFNRQKQRLLLEGKEYTPDDIRRCMVRGVENYPSAIWDLFLFLQEWFNDSPLLAVHTSGSTGVPKKLMVRKEQMMQSARLTCEYLNLQAGDTALLCTSCFRPSIVRYTRTVEVCGNGSATSL